MSRWRAVPFNLAYWRLFVVLIVSGLCLETYLLWAHRWDIPKGYADFTIFYSAANIIRSGQGKDLYNEQIQYAAQLAAAPDVKIRSWALPYNHPPFEALLFVPLSYLPYLASYLVWAALNLGMLFLAIRLLHESLTKFDLPALGVFGLAFIFFPVFITVFQGQDLLLLLLLASAAYAFVKRGEDFRAGCCLGLGLFRPELALPVALLIAFTRGRRFVAGFLVATLSLGLISCAIVGWRGLPGYVDYVWRMERVHGHGSIIPTEMPNLRGLVSLLFHSKTIQLIATAVTSVAVFAFSLQRICSDKISRSVEYTFCVAVLCTLLVSFHALVHDLALLVIPIMFVCAKWGDSQRQVSRTGEHCISFWSVLFFFCTPVLVYLWLGLGRFSLVALVLAAWLWSISAARQPISFMSQVSATGHA